jgi:O-antigen polymerase
MNGTQSGKSIIFLWTIAIISVLALIRFWLNPAVIDIDLSIVDLLLFFFILYVLFRNDWTELRHSLLFLELAGLAILYFTLRQQSNQASLWILLALSVGGLVQAIYGNLQLWGYFPSNHGIFKMTGSFFNPGPYSGYLAAVFPISLGFYLFNIPFSIIPKQNPTYLKLISFFNFTIALFYKITLKTHFFNNNNREISPPEEQKRSSMQSGYVTMKSFYLITIICICLVLPASRSRAAWIAVTVSSLYLISEKFQLFQQIKTYFNTRLKKLSLLFSLVILFITIGAGLYHFKKGSADGRLLIWKVSAEMVKDKPVFGHGYDGFKKHYMDYQAEYFKKNPDSEEAMFAGDNNYAFNEPIQLMVENGAIGILLLIATILLVFFRKYRILESKETREESIYQKPEEIYSLSPPSDQISIRQREQEQYLLHISRAVILSIMVFGLFSYPMQILPIKICLAVSFAITTATLRRKGKTNILQPICTNKKIQLALKSILSLGCFGLLCLATGHLTHIKTAYTNWKNAFDLYNIGIYDECLSDYKKAYPLLKTNGDFMTNYGKALSMAGKHVEAVEVLQLASKYYPNAVVYNALGDSYKKLEQTNQAEQAYLHAWHMNPSRFYSKYLLAKLYNETGQKEKAIEVAKELLKKDIKVGSTAIEEIKEEMKKIIEKGDAETLNKSIIPTDNNLNPFYKRTKEGTYHSVVITGKFLLQKW